MNKLRSIIYARETGHDISASDWQIVASAKKFYRETYDSVVQDVLSEIRQTRLRKILYDCAIGNQISHEEGQLANDFMFNHRNTYDAIFKDVFVETCPLNQHLQYIIKRGKPNKKKYKYDDVWDN